MARKRTRLPLDVPQVLNEQLAALVVHPTLVVVDAIGLARRPAYKAVKFTALQLRCLQEAVGRQLLDWP